MTDDSPRAIITLENIKMLIKRFDPALYAENDKIAKDKTIKLLKNSGFTVMENPSKKDVDLLVIDKKDQVILRIECEIKRVWKQGKFPYDNVQFPQRKRRLVVDKVPTLFIMYNDTLSDYLVVSDKELIKSPLVEVPNKFAISGEYFFQVPVNKAVFSDLLAAVNKAVRKRRT